MIVSNRENLGLYRGVVNVLIIGGCLGHGNFQMLSTFCVDCRSCEWIFVVSSQVNFVTISGLLLTVLSDYK